MAPLNTGSPSPRKVVALVPDHLSLIPCALLTTIISLSANRSLKIKTKAPRDCWRSQDAKAAQLRRLSFVSVGLDLNGWSAGLTILAESLPGLAEARRKVLADLFGSNT